jgi:hypothetical protein
MYSLDFWIYDKLLQELVDIKLHEEYSDSNILGIISSMMETMGGFLLYTTYLRNIGVTDLEELYEIYFVDVLNVSKNYTKKLKEKIKKLETHFKDILELWIDLDDNKNFFKIAEKNRNDFIKWNIEIYKSVSWEDVLWFKWFLKNITYYNKRYLIPK